MGRWQLRKGRDLIDEFGADVDPDDETAVDDLLKSTAKANGVDHRIAHLVYKERGASDQVFRSRGR